MVLGHGVLVPECQATWCMVGTYYASGLFLFLVGVWLYGLFLLCTNNCSAQQSMEVMLEDPNIGTPLSATPAAAEVPVVLQTAPQVANIPLENKKMIKASQ